MSGVTRVEASRADPSCEFCHGTGTIGSIDDDTGRRVIEMCTCVGHDYQGDNWSMDCPCDVCGKRVCDHVDQQHYCEDCKQTHWGDHNHCFLAEGSTKAPPRAHRETGPLCGLCNSGRVTWCATCLQWSSTCCQEYGSCQCS